MGTSLVFVFRGASILAAVSPGTSSGRTAKKFVGQGRKAELVRNLDVVHEEKIQNTQERCTSIERKNASEVNDVLDRRPRRGVFLLLSTLLPYIATINSTACPHRSYKHVRCAAEESPVHDNMSTSSKSQS